MWKGWSTTEFQSKCCVADQEKEGRKGERETLVEVVRQSGGGLERDGSEEMED
jgi:hypothetical protein